MIIVYNILITMVFLISLPLLPLLYIFSEKRRANLLLRLGLGGRLAPKKGNEKRIWVHALSVGEVRSAFPLVQSLKKVHPEISIVFTASTKTGFDTAKQLFFQKENRLADHLLYFPFDFWFSVKNVSEKIEPDGILIVETDLWPNFLNFHAKRQIPVVLINARLSNRSLKGYSLFKGFSAMFFSHLSNILVQTRKDAKRFEKLGIQKQKLMVAGNIKFDQPVPDFNKTGLLELKNNLGLENNTVVFLAGSTHEGEEIILADLFKDLKEQVPELVMVIVPRDPKRCKALLPVFLQRNINTALMSQLDKGQLKTDNPAFSHAILIDQMGLLAKLYAVCDLAFVGGSMVPEGGHNPLEPAAFSKPILFGPHMTDFDLIAKLLTQNIGGAMTVDSKKDLKRAATDILTDKQKQRQMGSNNYKVFCENSGAVQRIINHLEHMDFV